MAVKAFKFASPGVFLNEIDQSQIDKAPAPVGPIIIGRAQRGPAMRPVTVSSYDDFVSTFGEPVAGGDSSGDVWRSGVPSGPTYAAYAAQAWLANNPTVTFVRTLGVHSDASTGTTNNSGKAGWTVGTPSSTTSNGAYGLFVFPSSSAAGGLIGTLAAVWYCSGTVPVLSGSAYSDGSTKTNNACFIQSDASGYFTVIMSGSTGGGVGVDKGLTKKFNFTPTSGQFIRKVFNTNPQNVNTDSDSGLSTSNSSYYGYWLGETFENDIANNVFLGANTYTGSQFVGIITALNNFGNARLGYEAENDYAARTGWVIGQVAQGPVAAYNPATNAPKLFRFVATDAGEWIRNNLKVSISNIKPPQNEAQKYGTFNIEVRKTNDTDANKKIVESYVDCTLDPTSPNYIARRIGDMVYSWDENERTLNVSSGLYPLNSKYIRVEMYSDDLDSSLVPFGVLGPMKYKDSESLGSEFVAASGSAFANTSSVGEKGGQTYRYTFPSLRTRVSSSEDSLTTYKLANWGAATTRGASSLLYNDGVNDLLRVPVAGVAEFTSGVASTTLQYAWTFSLDNLVKSGSGYSTVYSYNLLSKANGTSFTATGSNSYVDLLNDGVNSFTAVFQGGTDGFNILESEPLRNTAMSSTSTNDNSYVYYTYRRVIDMVRDPESVPGNVLTIPGLVFEPLTNYMLSIAEQRKDVLAIIDASGDSDSEASYVTKYEVSNDNQGTNNRVSSVDQVVSQIKSRNLNSSYGATYYPWVQISDSNSGKIVAIPPSIVALGAMSYTDSVQAPWFAPAGFNRGGLSTGNAGVNVVNVVKKLSQTDRDKLYPVNINPIASFPNEGIVIFGQKTLQATPSALDRINVRRLMLYIKDGINQISSRILFEPNVEDTWNNFKDKAEPFLADVKARFGLEDYRLILDSTTTTPDLIDQNIMYAKVLLKPARAIEFIAVDFFITKSGANFNA